MFWLPAAHIALILAMFPLRHVRLAALILLGNWGACAGYWWVTGHATDWWALTLADFATAGLLMWLLPVSRAQVILVLLCACMILAHVAYGGGVLIGLGGSEYHYFETLTWLAWAQALVVGVWGLGEYLGGRRAVRRDVGCVPVDILGREP